MTYQVQIIYNVANDSLKRRQEIEGVVERTLTFNPSHTNLIGDSCNTLLYHLDTKSLAKKVMNQVVDIRYIESVLVSNLDNLRYKNVSKVEQEVEIK